VEEVCEAVAAEVEPLAAAKSLEIRIECPSGLPQLRSDRTKVRQIMLNLVGNAVKFTPEGTVTVSVAAEPDSFAFTVQDTGPGIAPRDLPHVFEEFTQFSHDEDEAKPQGTGLGLSVSLRLAKLLGGEIRVRSEVGKGSAFTLVLPKAPDAAPDPVSQAAAVQARDVSRDWDRVVLIIDDDPSIHDLFRLYLAREGHRVMHAYDLDTGMRLLRERETGVAILDLQFQDGSGWSLLKAIKDDEDLAHIPVILCTVSDERARGMRMGAFSYLVKPVAKDALVEEVRRAMRGGPAGPGRDS
jgi:CheY-like chemotaxis protein